MSSLAKNLLISPVLGFVAFMLDQYVRNETVQLPNTLTLVTSLVIYILAIFIGALLVSWGKNQAYHDDYHGDEDRESGEIKWFNSKKGYGFITRDQGDDVFVHYRDIMEDGDRHSLSDGQRVTFVVVQGDKGLQAEDVEVE